MIKSLQSTFSLCVRRFSDLIEMDVKLREGERESLLGKLREESSVQVEEQGPVER